MAYEIVQTAKASAYCCNFRFLLILASSSQFTDLLPLSSTSPTSSPPPSPQKGWLVILFTYCCHHSPVWRPLRQYWRGWAAWKVACNTQILWKAKTSLVSCYNRNLNSKPGDRHWSKFWCVWAWILTIIKVIFRKTLISNSFTAERHILSIKSGATAADMLIKPQVQHGKLIPIVAIVQPSQPPALPSAIPHPPNTLPACLQQRLPHHSTQNIPPLIGLCSSNMFVMKKQRIILSLLAGRAQFTKVEVGDKQRQYGWGGAQNNESPRCQGWAEYNWVQHLWALSP